MSRSWSSWMHNRSHRQSIISFSFIGYYLIRASVTSCIVNSNLRFRFNSRWLCKHNGEPKFAIVICMLWFYSKSKSPSSFFRFLAAQMPVFHFCTAMPVSWLTQVGSFVWLLSHLMYTWVLWWSSIFFLSIWFDLWKALNVYTNLASLGDDFVLLCLSCLFLGASDFFTSLSVVLCSLMCGSLPTSVSVIWLLWPCVSSSFTNQSISCQVSIQTSNRMGNNQS